MNAEKAIKVGLLLMLLGAVTVGWWYVSRIIKTKIDEMVKG